MSYKRDYNEIYSKECTYGRLANWEDKDPHVLKYFQSGNFKRVLDAGCGRGHHLKLLQSNGFEVFGIDVSDVCCNKYLAQYPHKCEDIVSYAEEGEQYDAILCTDVLEHISLNNLDATLEALTKLAPNALLGIANHRSRHLGIECHLIIKDEKWWLKKLCSHYDRVELYHKLSKLFFFIEVAQDGSARV